MILAVDAWSKLGQKKKKKKIKKTPDSWANNCKFYKT